MYLANMVAKSPVTCRQNAYDSATQSININAMATMMALFPKCCGNLPPANGSRRWHVVSSCLAAQLKAYSLVYREAAMKPPLANAPPALSQLPHLRMPVCQMQACGSQACGSMLSSVG